MCCRSKVQTSADRWYIHCIAFQSLCLVLQNKYTCVGLLHTGTGKTETETKATFIGCYKNVFQVNSQSFSVLFADVFLVAEATS